MMVVPEGGLFAMLPLIKAAILAYTPVDLFITIISESEPASASNFGYLLHEFMLHFVTSYAAPARCIITRFAVTLQKEGNLSFRNEQPVACKILVLVEYSILKKLRSEYVAVLQT